jgi:transglutaminase-like putative cysteine protease
MELRATSPFEAYLTDSWVIDYEDQLIQDLVYEQNWGELDPVECAESIFLFVRDEVKHSWDAQSPIVTCRASDVLKQRVGICYAKSHLMTALMRAVGVPAGLCYQKLLMTDDPADGHVLHGLNAIRLPEIHHWIRLDARGNKPGVNAEFSVDEEHLAFPVRRELGELDYDEVFAEPHPVVLEALQSSTDGLELYRCGLPNGL